MKTLFRKSNILHIRTNEGEFEVSNPEVLTCLHIRHMPDGDWRIKTPGSGWTGEDVKWPVEWPGGVELIEIPDEGRDMSGPPYPIVDFKTVARLIPEEKKAESAYKEFEKCTCPDDQCQLGDHPTCRYKVNVESSEPQEKSVSAPSESQEDQEELWKEARHYIDVWRIEELFKRFKITRKPE